MPRPILQRSAVPVIWTGVAVAVVSMAVHFRVPLLPDLGAELAMSPAALGLLTTIFGVGRLASDIPAGAMVDRLGANAAFAVAGLCVMISGLLFAAAPVASWVLAGSFVMGVGSAIANTTGMTFFSTRASAGRRGRALAGYSAALLGGQALGPAIAGWIAVVGTWRSAMAVAVGIGVLVVLVSALLRPGEATGWSGDDARTPAGLSGPRGSSTPRGSSSPRGSSTPRGSPEPHPPSPPPPAPEWRREDSPEVNPEPEPGTGSRLTGPQRLCLYGVSFTTMFVIAAMPQTLVPIIGASDLALSADVIGLALGLGGVLRIVGAFVGGPLSDRHGRKVLLVPGLLIQAAGVAMLMVTGSVLAWLAGVAIMSLASFGIGTGAAMLGDRTAAHRAGRALGRYRFVGDIGVVVGPLLAATLFEVTGQLVAVGMVSVLLLATAVAGAVVLPETYPGARRRRAG